MVALSSRQPPQEVMALRRQCRALQLALLRGHLRRAGWRTRRIPPAEPSESGAGASSLILNKRDKVSLHLALEDGKLVCGKLFPLRSEYSSDFSKEARRCPKMFPIAEWFVHMLAAQRSCSL